MSASLEVSVLCFDMVAGAESGAGMAGTLVALYIVHKKNRTAEREKRLQYWREQVGEAKNMKEAVD